MPAKMVGGRGMGVAKKRAGFWRRHRWLKWLAGGLLLVLLALGVAISVALHRAEPMLRAAIVEKLEEHFHARVELDSFHVSLVDGLTAEGKGLRIWPPAQVAGVTVPGANGATAAASPGPLIKLDEFRFHAPLRYKPGKPIRISVVRAEGAGCGRAAEDALHARGRTVGASSGQVPALAAQYGAALLHFEVDSIECNDANLTLETEQAGQTAAGVCHRPHEADRCERGRADALRRGADQSAAAGNDFDLGQHGAVGGGRSGRDAGGGRLPV